MDINKSIFQNRGSGERFWGSLNSDAVFDADNLRSYLSQANLYYSAQEILPKLENLQVEQNNLENTINEQIAELDKRLENPKSAHDRDLDNDQRSKLLFQYEQTQTILSQLEMVIKGCKSVKKPIFPVWLRELLIAELITE